MARSAAADQLIGFDWLAYLLWFDRHPALTNAMGFFYTGLSTYSTIFFLVILFSNRDPRKCCGEFIALFFTTATSCIAIGLFFPALSAAIHYAPPLSLFDHIDPRFGAYHLGHLYALRSDAMPVLSLDSLPGLVTFPSFHTAMGVIAIYCCRTVPPLFAVSLAINLLMIASTPIFGAHYLIDLLGGAAVAVAAIAAHRWLQSRGQATHLPISRPI